MEASTTSRWRPSSRIPNSGDHPWSAACSHGSLLIYGWAARHRVHWIVVDIGVFIAMFGSQVSGMAWQAYIMDAYADRTSSARAATQLSASLTAFLSPLFVPSMYRAMGYGWGNTAMAFASLTLAVPGPIALWYYGPRLRARARSTH